MLQAWGALNDTKPDRGDAPGGALSDEAREVRARAAYDGALRAHGAGDVAAATKAYTALAHELAPRAAAPARVGSKRPRAAAPPPPPAWATALRYASLRNLGDLRLGERRFVPALEAYADALRADGGDPVVWRAAARAALACGRLHVARRALEHALVLRPGHWLCMEDLRVVLACIGDGDEDVGGCDGLGDAEERVVEAMEKRDAWFVREKEASRKMRGCWTADDEVLWVERPTWLGVVNALRACLKKRLSVAQDAAPLVGTPVSLALQVGAASVKESDAATRSSAANSSASLALDLPGGNDSRAVEAMDGVITAQDAGLSDKGEASALDADGKDAALVGSAEKPGKLGKPLAMDVESKSEAEKALDATSRCGRENSSVGPGSDPLAETRKAPTRVEVGAAVTEDVGSPSAKPVVITVVESPCPPVVARENSEPEAHVVSDRPAVGDVAAVVVDMTKDAFDGEPSTVTEKHAPSPLADSIEKPDVVLMDMNEQKSLGEGGATNGLPHASETLDSVGQAAAADPQNSCGNAAAQEVGNTTEGNSLSPAVLNRETAADKPAEQKTSEGKTSEKSTELRKSKRQADIGARDQQERERRRTREAAAAEKKDSLQDWNLAPVMIGYVLNLVKSPDVEMSDVAGADLSCAEVSGPAEAPGDTECIDLTAETSTWRVQYELDHEAKDVTDFIALTRNGSRNSGPIDLLLQVLDLVQAKRSLRVSEAIGLAWLGVRRHVGRPPVSTFRASMLVVEALLNAGDASSKESLRLARHNEATTLVTFFLSVAEDAKLSGEFSEFLTLLGPECDSASSSSSIPSEDICRQLYSAALSRVYWVFAQLAERSRDMQGARDRIVKCLDYLSTVAEDENFVVPDIGGPYLGGLPLRLAVGKVRALADAYRSGGELEDACASISLAKETLDASCAQKACALLKPALKRAVVNLSFDVPHTVTFQQAGSSVSLSLEDPFAKFPERGSSARLMTETQLEVFLEACVLCKDDVGSLVCLSVKLKALVIDHGRQLFKEMRDKLTEQDDKSSKKKKRSNSESSSALESTGAILNIVLSELRPYAASIRRVINMLESKNVDAKAAVKSICTDWTANDALLLTAKALVAVAHLLQARIPAMSISPKASISRLDLSAPEKNQRLGISRTMLGFARCMEGLSFSTSSKLDDRISETTHALKSVFFSLRALGPRGCVRQEGTSRALIKLYISCLTRRLHQLAELSHVRAERSRIEIDGKRAKGIVAGASSEIRTDGQGSSTGEALHGGKQKQVKSNIVVDVDEENESSGSSSGDGESSLEDVDNEIARTDDIDWNDVSIVRSELAQCYSCLFGLADLEALTEEGQQDESTWLTESLRLSQRLGVSFGTGDTGTSDKAPLDMESCRRAFGFYRLHLFEALRASWRDGKRSRKARDVVSDIVDALGDTIPAGVPAVSEAVLDNVMPVALEQGGKFATDMLKSEWSTAVFRTSSPGGQSPADVWLLSRMHFEVHVMRALGVQASYESDFKKQRSVERRRHPKEVFERLVNQACHDGVAALRSRPWCAGGWILQGRLLLEVVDVALDEREYASSTFGICRSEDLASGDLGDPISGLIGRAEGCFRIADALARDTWMLEQDEIPVAWEGQLNADFFAAKTEGSEADTPWIGSENLFQSFGLAFDISRRTPSLRAASHFGLYACYSTKLREERYWSRCWHASALTPRPVSRRSEKFPSEVVETARYAMSCLEKGMRFASAGPAGGEVSLTSVQDGSGVPDATRPSESNDLPVLTDLSWYYVMQQGKLSRKLGEAPAKYLRLFADAAAQNAELRNTAGEPPDVEPIYRIHATRLKLLLEEGDSLSGDLLDVLEQFSYKDTYGVDVPQTGVGDYGSMFTVMQTGADSVGRRRLNVARDVMLAMKHCRHKAPHAYSEFFFKAVYVRALVIWKILKCAADALKEMSQLFRSDAAAKSMESEGEAVHRGYFYTMWNYRYTDTSFELTLENERKYLRWRTKLLGLYAAVLEETKDSRRLAGIISRLKRRSPEDLPVNGALLDDLVGSYSDTCISNISQPSGQFATIPTVALSEKALRRTWDVYVETVRLTQGVRRARQSIEREPETTANLKSVIDSRRPWCLVAAACALHVEHRRLEAARDSRHMSGDVLSSLPINCESLDEISPEVFANLASSIEYCVERWTLEKKLLKLIRRRIAEYQAGGPLVKSLSQSRRVGGQGRGSDVEPMSFGRGDTGGTHDTNDLV